MSLKTYKLTPEQEAAETANHDAWFHYHYPAAAHIIDMIGPGCARHLNLPEMTQYLVSYGAWLHRAEIAIGVEVSAPPKVVVKLFIPPPASQKLPFNTPAEPLL